MFSGSRTLAAAPAMQADLVRRRTMFGGDNTGSGVLSPSGTVAPGGMEAAAQMAQDPQRRPSEIEAAARNGTSNTMEAFRRNAADSQNVGTPTPPGAGYGGGMWNADRRVTTPVDQHEAAPASAPHPNLPVASASSGPAPQTNPLGGSMRRPFDYAAAMAALNPPEKQHSKTHNILMALAESIGPTLMALGGDTAGAAQFNAGMANQRREAERRRYESRKILADWQHDDWSRQNGADLSASAPFTVGRDRLAYNPATGETASLYHGQADFESYAATMGFKPGSPQYMAAAQDYVLRSNGPTAYSNDTNLDDYRTGNRLKIEGVRQGNRVGLEGVRQGNRVSLDGTRQHDRMATRGSPTYHDSHPSPRRGSNESLPVVATPEAAMRLPSGTRFRTPDGAVKVRP